MKKMLIFLSLSIALSAGQYARLKDGTIVILKDDGTWEKVETIPLPNKPKSDAKASTSKSSSNKANQNSATEKSDPLKHTYLQKLQGVWRSGDGSLRYIVRGNDITIVEERKRRKRSFTIQRVTPKKKEILLNIGEVDRAGAFSLGGELRKLRFGPDFSTLTDLSKSIPAELYRE